MTENTEKFVWMNGELVPASQASVSVFDHGVLYGDGIFEGIRAYNGKILKLRSHLERLFDGAQAIMLEIPYSLDELYEATQAICEKNGIENGYIRLVVTRGSGTLGLNPFLCKDGAMVFIIADTIQLYPEEYYEKGLSIVTAATIRNHPNALSPRIKSLNYLNNIMAKIEAINAGAMEAIMLNHQGYVAECTGDNIFLVNHTEEGPVISSPPLHAGVLEGITMHLVLDLAEKAGIPIKREDITRYDVYTADEVFLTGTAAEVIPVVEIDRRSIGDGKPGKTTCQLITAFRELVKDAPED